MRDIDGMIALIHYLPYSYIVIVGFLTEDRDTSFMNKEVELMEEPHTTLSKVELWAQSNQIGIDYIEISSSGEREHGEIFRPENCREIITVTRYAQPRDGNLMERMEYELGYQIIYTKYIESLGHVPVAVVGKTPLNPDRVKLVDVYKDIDWPWEKGPGPTLWTAQLTNQQFQGLHYK
jgi:hypothetical protein